MVAEKVLMWETDMVLEDVTEYEPTGETNHLDKILLNGNNICMVSARMRGCGEAWGGVVLIVNS